MCACASHQTFHVRERINRHRIPFMCDGPCKCNASICIYISFVLLQINQFICWQVELSHERNMRKFCMCTHGTQCDVGMAYRWTHVYAVVECGAPIMYFIGSKLMGLLSCRCVDVCAYGKTCRSSPLCSRYKLRCVEIRCLLCCCRQVIDMCQNHFMSFMIQVVTHFTQHRQRE